MTWILLLAYLIFSATGFWAVILFFTVPDTDGRCGDVTLWEAVLFGVVALIPVAGTIAGNLFWLFHVTLKFPKIANPVVFKARNRNAL